MNLKLPLNIFPVLTFLQLWHLDHVTVEIFSLFVPITGISMLAMVS